MVSDRQLASIVSVDRYELPSNIAKRAGVRRLSNASLGRLYRAGILERVPGPACFMYRSKQMRIK